MDTKDYLNRPGMDRFVKRIVAGEFLFYQGQLATTMIVIVQGQIHLIGEKEGDRYVASILDSGSFLGEKIILGGKPYQRAFSAKAEIDTLYLEFSAHDLDQLQKTSPEILTDLLKRVIGGVAERFDRANYLIRALRSSNNHERLLQCILYFSRSSGRKSPEGIEVILSADSLHFYVDMETAEIQAALDHLVGQNILVRQADDRYRIPSEQALITYIPNFSRQAIKTAA